MKIITIGRQQKWWAPQHAHSSLGGLFCLLLAMSLAGLPAAAKSPKRDGETDPKQDLVWPLPPAPPRIRYVRSLHGSTDFRKKPSRWRRLLLGPEKEKGIALSKPYGVTTDADGRIYVTDTGLGAVVRFDPAAREVRLLGHEGRVRLATPIGIVLDDRGRVFVSDVDLDRVFCFGNDGEVLLSLGAEQKLRNPAGLAIDEASRRLYVADSHLHRIFVYSTDGRFLTAWGSRGNREGQFNYPTNVALDGAGNVYVVDTGNFRVQTFDPDGTFLSAFGGVGDGPGRFHRPKGIALDGDGHIYVVDAAFNNFQIFNPAGELLLFVGAPGRGPGDFWLPAGMHIDRAGRVHVVDQVNQRIQIFQYLRPVPSPPVAARSPETPSEPMQDRIAPAARKAR